MNSKPLEGLKIIDLSTRLPGPLSTKILSDLGANVLKIEDIHYGDPFNHLELSQIDPGLEAWYQVLNAKKSIIKLDFKDSLIKEKIYSHTHDCDGIILGINETLQKKLGVHPLEFKSKNVCTFLEIKSQLHLDHGMHDLNILAETYLLNSYLHNKNNSIEAPPFLPIAGINFGQSIANHFLAHLFKAQKTKKNSHGTCFLDESIKKTLALFFDHTNPIYTSLHNGLFPCYNLYKTKDQNYVALAAVEEKFWSQFLKLFGLPQNLDRFNTAPDEVFAILKNLFSNKTLAELSALTQNQDICLSLIKID